VEDVMIDPYLVPWQSREKPQNRARQFGAEQALVVDK